MTGSIDANLEVSRDIGMAVSKDKVHQIITEDYTVVTIGIHVVSVHGHLEKDNTVRPNVYVLVPDFQDGVIQV